MGDTPSAKNDKNNSNLQHMDASRDDSTAEFRIMYTSWFIMRCMKPMWKRLDVRSVSKIGADNGN